MRRKLSFFLHFPVFFLQKNVFYAIVKPKEGKAYAKSGTEGLYLLH